MVIELISILYSGLHETDNSFCLQVPGRHNHNLPPSTGTSTTWSSPSYFGTSNPYLSATSGPKNLPPKKCRPVKNFTNGFGAVKLINASGINPFPGPSFGGPSSMFQLLGASTASTGTFVSLSASITLGNGSRTSPENEKPKMASTTWSVDFSAVEKSSVKGTLRFSSCFLRRW